MSEELKHMKVKTFTPLGDGSMQVDTESYYEKLSGVKQEIEKKIPTSNQTLLSDVIACLDVLKGKGTPELTLVIKSDANMLPKLIVKTYTVSSESFGRRGK